MPTYRKDPEVISHFRHFRAGDLIPCCSFASRLRNMRRHALLPTLHALAISTRPKGRIPLTFTTQLQGGSYASSPFARS
jgi:hypothetical protein